ncbi:MAG: ribosome-binding factor A [bacterium]|nr:ribosome-binding factor A [bacterium]
MTRRIEKINKLLAQEVSRLFLTEIDFPEGIFVTVGSVDTSPDLKYADILVAIIPDNKTGTALGIIRKKIYKIQKALDRRLEMRPVPKLRFSPAATEPDRISELFQKIKEEEKPEEIKE